LDDNWLLWLKKFLKSAVPIAFILHFVTADQILQLWSYNHGNLWLFLNGEACQALCKKEKALASV
jgi:hypothetical protein